MRRGEVLQDRKQEVRSILRRPDKLVLLTCLCVFLLGAGARIFQFLYACRMYPAVWYLSGVKFHKPMLTGADSYYFLKKVSDGFSLSAKSFLPSVVWAARSVSGMPEDTIAFYLPVFVCGLSGLLCLLLTRLLVRDRWPVVGSCSALFLYASPLWYTATKLGRFDNNALTVLAVLTGAVLVFLLRSRPVRSLFAFLLFGFLSWWIGGARVLALYLLVAVAGIISSLRLNIKGHVLRRKLSGGTVSETSLHEQGRKVLHGLAVCSALLVFAIALSVGLHLALESGPVKSFAGDIKQAVFVYVEGKNAGYFFSPLSLVSETGRATLVWFFTYPLALLIVPALLGCLLYTVKEWKAEKRNSVWFAVVFSVLFLLTLLVKRIGIFLLPFLCFGISYLLYEMCRLLTQDRGKRAVLMGAVSCVCFFVMLVYTTKAYAVVKKYQVYPYRAILEEAKKRIGEAPDGSLVWTWRDYGNMASYFLGIPAFCDAGDNGTSERVYISAMSLFSPYTREPQFSAGWIRFFAVHGADELVNLGKRCFNGDVGRAADLLIKAFLNGKSELEKIKDGFCGLGREEWKMYLFPRSNKRVFLYIPERMLHAYSVIDFVSSWDPGRKTFLFPGPSKYSYYEIRVPDYVDTPQKAVLWTSAWLKNFYNKVVGHRIEVTDFRVFDKQKREWVLYRKPASDRDIFEKQGVIIYGGKALFGIHFIDEVVVRLFTGEDVPYFREVARNGEWGGVWEVLPIM